MTPVIGTIPPPSSPPLNRYDSEATILLGRLLYRLHKSVVAIKRLTYASDALCLASETQQYSATGV